MEEAASIPLVGLTAWQALIEKAGLKKGQKVFIQAGSGGVGTFAIQLAKHVGATVATTTSTDNVNLVRSLGADIVIDYKKDDFENVLSGYDVVLNSLDKLTLEKSLASAEAWRTADLHFRSTRSRLCARHRRVVDRESGHALLELRGSSEGKTPSGALLVSVHESERRSVDRDHGSDRLGNHPTGRGSGLPVRIDQ